MTRDKTIKRAIEALDGFRREVRETEPSELDLLDVERRLRDVLNEVGCECMGEAMERADAKAPMIEYAGQRWGNRRESPATYTTSFGDTKLVRATYQRSGGGKVAVPLELRLGIVEGRYSPQAARLLTRAVAVMTSEEAEGWLKEAGVATVSRSTIDRLPKAVAARYERNREVIEQAVREEDEIPDDAVVVQVSLDGVMVPQDGEHAKPRGRKTETPELPRHEKRYSSEQSETTRAVPAAEDGAEGRAWHEAFVGTIAFWNAEGEHLKTTYIGRMPESGHETVATMLEDEIHAVLAERPDLDVSFASDGDALQWTQLEGIAAGLPQHKGRRTTFNLDFWHAGSYLHAVATAAFGDTADAKVQAEQWKATLKEHEDGAARVLKSMRYFRDRATSDAARDEIDANVAFLAKQAAAGRMNYKHSRDLGHPIATGTAEAGAKTLVNVRMKRAGSRYEQHGGQTQLTFRASVLSRRFDALWQHIHASYQNDVREVAA
jgi:hypothetical protein